MARAWEVRGMITPRRPRSANYAATACGFAARVLHPFRLAPRHEQLPSAGATLAHRPPGQSAQHPAHSFVVGRVRVSGFGVMVANRGAVQAERCGRQAVGGPFSEVCRHRLRQRGHGGETLAVGPGFIPGKPEFRASALRWRSQSGSRSAPRLGLSNTDASLSSPPFGRDPIGRPIGHAHALQSRPNDRRLHRRWWHRSRRSRCSASWATRENRYEHWKTARPLLRCEQEADPTPTPTPPPARPPAESTSPPAPSPAGHASKTQTSSPSPG